MKDISVTNDFLSLDKTTINCQNEESLKECKTRRYITTMTEECKCLPFAIISNENDVSLHKNKITFNILIIAGSLFYSRPAKMYTKL